MAQAWKDYLLSLCLLISLMLLSAGCAKRQAALTPAGTNRQLSQATGAQETTPPDDGQWTMPAKNYASTRFSSLDQINTGNVSSLKLAWTFSAGVLRGHEAAPIVANNTMFIVTPFPNLVYALDLTQPGAPLKWKYDPQPASAAQGV